MTDLIDRLSGTDPTRPKIGVEQFCSGLLLYALGLVSAGEPVQDWDLQGAEHQQAVAIRQQIDARPTANAKLSYVLQVQAVARLIEITDDTLYHYPDDTINKSRVLLHWGIPGVGLGDTMQ